jgi:hypothetical protein
MAQERVLVDVTVDVEMSRRDEQRTNPNPAVECLESVGIWEHGQIGVRRNRHCQ